MTRTLEAPGQLLVPTSVRRRAGIKVGDRLKFETSRGVITIRKSDDEDDEYTAEQRAAIRARLEESFEGIRQGRVYGPFTTQEEFVASLRAHGKTLPLSKRTKTSRRT